MDGLKDHLVTVITPAGIIKGTPVLDDEDNGDIKFMCDINKRISTAYRKNLNLEDNQTLPDNDGFFTLKNVKLISGNNIDHFNALNIFFDQIIAITLSTDGS